MPPVILCYIATWAHYRPAVGKFEVSNIDPQLCTHLVYAFLDIADSGEITYLDKKLDIDQANIAKVVALKRQNSKLKVLASVGGWSRGSTKFSNMSANVLKRRTFITSAVKLLHEHGFDGLDIDWEYPARRGGDAADRSNFVTLLEELKSAFGTHNYLLTVAVAAAPKYVPTSYDIPGIMQHVDFVNIMAYSFSGHTQHVVGHNTPLKGPAENNIKYCIDSWLQQGALAHKILLGIRFYARTFTLTNKANHDVGASCSGPGIAGPYTRDPGTLANYEICAQSGNWTKLWDAACEVPFAYYDDQWISYDDTQSLEKKMNFIRDYKLGGAMVWSLDADDFHGACGETYPLLKTIKASLNGK